MKTTWFFSETDPRNCKRQECGSPHCQLSPRSSLFSDFHTEVGFLLICLASSSSCSIPPSLTLLMTAPWQARTLLHLYYHPSVILRSQWTIQKTSHSLILIHLLFLSNTQPFQGLEEKNLFPLPKSLQKQSRPLHSKQQNLQTWVLELWSTVIYITKEGILALLPQIPVFMLWVVLIFTKEKKEQLLTSIFGYLEGW